MTPAGRMAPGCRGQVELEAEAEVSQWGEPEGPASDEPAPDEWPVVERHPV